MIASNPMIIMFPFTSHTKRRNNQLQSFILPETGDQKESEVICPTEETNPSGCRHQQQLIPGGTVNPPPADPLPPPPPANPPRDNNHMTQNNNQ